MPKLTHEQRDERRAQVIADVKKGRSLDEVADRYGLSVTYVSLLAGVGRPRSSPSSAWGIVAKLQNEPKKTYQEIANELGVTKQRVGQVLATAKKHGMRFPGRTVRA